MFMTMALSFGLSFTAHAATYTVASGDSLYTIGKLFNTTSTQIMQDNKLTSTTIYPGQALNVQASAYTVKAGDSLYFIAKNNGISLTALRTINNIWTDYINVGQVLYVPKVSTSTTAGNTSAGTSTSTSSKYVIPATSAEVDLLARLITAEAQNQSYTAMVAVGAVIVNRVQDPAYPKTVTNVIYQVDHGYYQFSPVLNGWIDKPAIDAARNAAIAALQGVDPTNGALFYFDDSTTNTWLWSKAVALRSGNMVFSY